MAEHEHRPLEEDYDNKHVKIETPTALDMENLERDMTGMVEVEGAEAVADALTQVATGHAQSHELMAWIDNLRDPNRKAPEPVAPDGFLHDFEADSELAAAALEVPTDDTPPAAPEIEDTGASDDDDNYFFSTTRKRKPGDDDDEDGDDKPVDGEAKPAAVKAPKTKSTKKP